MTPNHWTSVCSVTGLVTHGEHVFQKSPLTFPAQSLEKEVQKVKATLQTMLAQLKEEDEDEVNALTDDVLMKNVTDDDEEDEEDEEEEDQYFSDSWDI